MNRVHLYGRMTKQPELRYTQAGTAYTRFILAVDRNLSKEKRQEAEQRGEPTADFVPCKTWGKMAEFIANYFGKGDPILLEGHINTGKYDQNGQTIYTTDVVVERAYFTAGRSQQQQRDNSQRARTPQDFTRTDEVLYPIDDDEVPF